MFRLHSLHIFQHFLYIIHTCTLHRHTHTCTHTHVFCQHFREMGSHENWERETEIKIGVWQAKEKTLPDPHHNHHVPHPCTLRRAVSLGRSPHPHVQKRERESERKRGQWRVGKMRPTFLVPRLAPAVAAAATATDDAVNVSAGVAILF